MSRESSREAQSDAPLAATTLRRSVAAVVLLVVAGATYARLFFGVDFTDEAFYTAVPYRFATGAHPLRDETLLVQQTSGLLLYPFVKSYSEFVGLDGIILFARHLHYLFEGLVALAVFVGLRRSLIDGALTALIAGTAIAFVPFGIPALSYDTFASGFFAAGCFLGLGWLGDRRRPWLYGAGAALGLAIFTYPPIAVAVTAYVVALYAVSHPRSARAMIPLLAPIALFSVGAAVFFVSHGLEAALDLVRRSRVYGGQGGGFDKAVHVLSTVASGFPHKLFAIGLLVAAGVLRKRFRYGVLPLLALPLAALPPDLRSSASANEFVTNLGLVAPALFLLIPRSEFAQRLMVVIWLPAAIGGEMTSVSSSNGGINFAIGFFPAAIVALTLVPVIVRDSIREPAWRTLGTLVEFVPVIAALVVAVTLDYASVYRDSSLFQLTTRIGDGAYAGIYTSAGKRTFLSALEHDLSSDSGPGCGILFYDSFPAGYLLGAGRSDTNSTWTLDVAGRGKAPYQRLLLGYFRARGKVPDVAVRFGRIPLTDSTGIRQSYAAREPLEVLLASPRYETVRTRPDYVIRRLRTSSCHADRNR